MNKDVTIVLLSHKSKEFKKCSDAGIKIVEIKVGYDGIVLAIVYPFRLLIFLLYSSIKVLTQGT